MAASEVGAFGNETELPGGVGGDYVVERVQGQGPLGTLFLARGAQSGRPVVVKVLAGRLAGDVYALAAVLRKVGGDRLPPWLTALVDAGLAHPSVRPSAFDFFHEVLARTSPPEVWIAAADVTPAPATS